MRFLPRILALSLASSGTASAATFTWLGDFLEGETSSYATVVSADGAVVAGHFDSPGGRQVFVYRAGAMAVLGDLPGTTPVQVTAKASSADGRIIVGNSGGYPSGRRPRAVLWRDGVIEDLGTLPPADPIRSSHALGVSGDGALVVGSSTDAVGLRPATHAQGQWQNLASLTPYDYAELPAVSPDGRIIAGQQRLYGVMPGEAFLFVDGVYELIPVEAGSPYPLLPMKVTDGGIVVGFVDPEVGYLQGFRRAAGVTTYIGTQDTGTLIYAVSADGGVLAGSADLVDPFSAGRRAILWTDAQGHQAIENILLAQGATGVNRNFIWLYETMAISADGRTVAGWGLRSPQAPAEAWVAVLDSPLAPDIDGDGLIDSADNCVTIANADQMDTDRDTYGNACDGDFDGSGGLVNVVDLAYFRAAFGTSDHAADLNGDGIVNAVDLAKFRQLYGKPAGPSGWDMN